MKKPQSRTEKMSIEKKENDKVNAKEMRKQAMERMRQTKKRKNQ